MDGGNHETGPAEAGKAEKRNPHSIRFLDGEWDRIEAHADARGLTGPEFVRFAALAALADGRAAGHRLAPLIETTFRAAHIMVTKMRAEMLDEDREDELDELIEGAREYQDRLLGRERVERSGADRSRARRRSGFVHEDDGGLARNGGVHGSPDPGPAPAQ